MSVNDSHNNNEKQGEPVSKSGSENACDEFFISNVNEKDGQVNRWEVLYSSNTLYTADQA